MDPEIKPGQNTGVTEAAPPPSGWVAGGETGLAPVVLEGSGQYDSFLPDEESQSRYTPYGFDTMACVTFSATNSIEILIERLRSKGLLPATHEAFLQNNGYIDKLTGKVNFSDRFTAKMSGTTVNGNSLGAVAESIRDLHGLLPESDWSFPVFTDAENQDGQLKWVRYYADIPQALQAKAKKFLTYFKIPYQWIANGSSTPVSLRGFLQYGPFQIAAAVCPPWNNNEADPPIKSCGCSTQHATTIYGFRDDLAFKDFDHYKSFRKLLAQDYCIPYALQYSLEVKSLTPPAPTPAPGFHYVFNVNLKFGMPAGPEVHKLQEALQYLKRTDGTTYMKPGVFGPFGPSTRVALALFQSDHGIPDPDGPGTNFGPKGRAAMNTLVQ